MSRPKREGTTHLVITFALALLLALPLMVASSVASVASVASVVGVDATNGSSRPGSGQLPDSGCIPVPAAECGTIRVPLDRSEPGGPSIPIGYALIRHQNQSKAAIGTVVPNPGGPGESTIDSAPFYTEILAPLLADHDLLLIDPRGIGLSGPIRCGLAARPPTRERLTLAIGECWDSLGARARDYTSAETADDIDAVRAHLGIPRLDLLGESYGTYLMTVYAQRHPNHVRSIVLSSAYPLAFDMCARPNARAAERPVVTTTRPVAMDRSAAMSAGLGAKRTSEVGRVGLWASVDHVDQTAQYRDVFPQGLAAGAGKPDPRRASPRPDAFATAHVAGVG